MAFGIPQEIINAAQENADWTTASGSHSADEIWSDWQDIIRRSQNPHTTENYSKSIFWIVVSLPGNNYSERLEYHHDIPMLIPSSGTGTMLGVASSKAELTKMIEEDAQGKYGKTGNVHLTYKVVMKGEKAWRSLLEFLAYSNLIEKE